MQETNKMDKLFAEGGINTTEQATDPVSGNEVPPGSLPEEVRDDVPAKLSAGEYVVPADVLRFYGVAFFEKLRAKAKAGLEEMDKEGRIGGGTEEEDDDLPFDVEELQAEDDGEEGQAFAKGGVVNPEEQQLLNAQPTFNPNQWGFGGTTYTPPAYQAPVNVATNPAVPPQTELPKPEKARGGAADLATRTSAAGSQSEGAQAGGNWAKDLDFTNPQSVLDWADKQAKGTLLDKGITAAGALLGGPLGAGLAGAVTKTNNIAQIRAAARLAGDAGNTTLQTQLEDLADSQLEGSPVKSIVDTLATGNKYYESAVEAKKKSGTATTKSDNKPIATAPKKSSTSTATTATKPTIKMGSTPVAGKGIMTPKSGGKISVTGSTTARTGTTTTGNMSKGLTGGGKAKGGLIQKPSLTKKTK